MLAGSHLSSIPINSSLIDVGHIKVNEAAVHLLREEAVRVLSLIGRKRAYKQGQWFLMLHNKTKSCLVSGIHNGASRLPHIAP